MRDIVGYLQPHMEALDELRLDRCGQLIVGLSQAINERQNKMVLHIRRSYLDEDGAKALGDCLRNISKLRIVKSRIYVQCRIILREAVQQLPNPQDLVVDDGGDWREQNGDRWMKTWTVYGHDEADDLKRILQLEPGKITRLSLQAWYNPGWCDELEMREIVGYLQAHMEALNELRLDGYGQLIVGLSQAINERQNKMDLDIMRSNLDDDGAKALGDCLRNISTLRIDERSISVQSRIILREAVQQLPNPQDLVVDGYGGLGIQNGDQWMKTWTLYKYDEADDVKRILQLEPEKITRLSLEADDDIFPPRWYKELEMREIAGYLQPHMEALDELRLDGCGQLIVGLSQAINERQNKMVLHIRRSKLDDDGAKALGDCLRNISKLHIEERRISVQSRIILHKAVQQLSNPQAHCIHHVNSVDYWVQPN